MSRFDGMSWSDVQYICDYDIAVMRGDVDGGLVAISFATCGPTWSIDQIDGGIKHIGDVKVGNEKDFIYKRGSLIGYINVFRLHGDMHLEYYDNTSKICTMHNLADNSVTEHTLPTEAMYVDTHVIGDQIGCIGYKDVMINPSYNCYKLASRDELHADFDGSGVIGSTIYGHFSIWDVIFARDIRMSEPFVMYTNSSNAENSYVLESGIIASVTHHNNPEKKSALQLIDLRAPTESYLWPLPDEYTRERVKCECIFCTYLIAYAI